MVSRRRGYLGRTVFRRGMVMVVLAVVTVLAFAQTLPAQNCPITQITKTEWPGAINYGTPRISADGKNVLFSSNKDLIPGNNTDGSAEIFHYNVITDTLTQLTHSNWTQAFAGCYLHNISSDGNLIAMGCAPDGTIGTNHLYVLNRSTNFMKQVTTKLKNVSGFISANGNKMVVTSYADIVPPGNQDEGSEVFLYDIATSTFKQITFNEDNNCGLISSCVSDGIWISADGRWIVINSNADLFGNNSNKREQIILYDALNGILSQVTNSNFDSYAISMSDDGSLITLRSNADLDSGKNTFNAEQYFIYDRIANTFTQLDDLLRPVISRDGTKILAVSNADLVAGGNADGNRDLFVYDIPNSTYRQVTNTTDPNSKNRSYDMNSDATIIVFHSNQDLVPGENPNGYHELFLSACAVNSPPVAVCKDVSVIAPSGSCSASASIDGGSYDPDGDPLTYDQSPPGPYPLGENTVLLTVTDDHSASSSCSATVTVVEADPPIITCPAGKIVECNTSTDSTVTGYATATDICDPSPKISYKDAVSQGTCPQQSTIQRTWAATDKNGNASSCTQIITIVDTTPPIILLPPANITVECDAVPPPATVSAMDNCDPSPTIQFTETRVDGNCPSNYELQRTWVAKDSCGNATSYTQVVTVQDTTPPIIANITATPNVLWPPNHKMIPISVTASAVDTCDAEPVCKISSVSSNEPEDGLGDGNTAPDWKVTGDLSLNLRAERSGKGSGRIYTIAITCTDVCGNSSLPGNVVVNVPHNLSKK